MIDKNLKAEILECLAKINAVESAIAFGSQVSGCASQDSDLDLLVILKTAGSSQSYREFLERKMVVMQCLKTIAEKIPLDLIVYTHDEWEKLKMSNSDFVRNIRETQQILVDDVPTQKKDARSRLSQFQNTITLPEDPLQFQRKMRNEWK